MNQRVVEIHGERGRVWIESLPDLARQCARRWSLSLGTPFHDLSYNYVAPATLPDGSDVILKLGVPHREVTTEIAALRLFDGRGAVRLIDADPGIGAVLLERAVPGRSLLGVDDDHATRTAAAVMKELWRPVPASHGFPTLAEWALAFNRLRSKIGGGTGPLPRDFVDRAEQSLSGLAAAGDRNVVLHGDLHHENILSATRSPYLAIDPKGVVGAPEFEVGASLRNGAVLIAADPGPLLRRRIAIFSEELGFARPTLRDAAFAQAMLSACWSIEDHGAGWEGPLRIATCLDGLRV